METMTPQKGDTALLVMDMQESLAGNLSGSDQLIPRIFKAIEHARASGVPVIYVTVAFRTGYPEIHPEHRTFRQLPVRMPVANMNEMMKIVPALAPKEGEIVVVKKRFSAFSGSDLEIVLRSQGIRHLVLTGIVTSGVVLATFVEAGDKDYILTILADGCMDRDPAVHQVLMEKVFTRLADVVTVEAWCAKAE